VRVSKDHKIAVAGDKSGNLTVLETASWTRVASLAAHDSEVVAIDVVVVEQDARWLVTSGSRDRLVHVFEAYYDAQGKLQFVPVQTFDDHTSAVTSICFGREGKLLISSSSDKSVIFRTSPKPGRQPYALQHQHTSRQTVLDMALYSDGSCVVLVGQDKRVTVLNVASGQIKQSFKPDTLDQSLVSIALDASNTVAFATAADKSIRVIDLVTEACIAGATGHGELVTTVQYVPQLQRIVSAAADGCVFHWKLAPQIVQLLAQRNGKTIASEPSEKENQEALKNAAFLPAWLRTKLDGAQQQQQQQQQQPMAQQGRWALPKEMQVHNEAKGSSIVVNLSKPLLADRRLTIEPDGTIVSVINTSITKYNYYCSRSTTRSRKPMGIFSTSVTMSSPLVASPAAMGPSLSRPPCRLPLPRPWRTTAPRQTTPRRRSRHRSSPRWNSPPTCPRTSLCLPPARPSRPGSSSSRDRPKRNASPPASLAPGQAPLHLQCSNHKQQQPPQRQRPCSQSRSAIGLLRCKKRCGKYKIQ